MLCKCVFKEWVLMVGVEGGRWKSRQPTHTLNCCLAQRRSAWAILEKEWHARLSLSGRHTHTHTQTQSHHQHYTQLIRSICVCVYGGYRGDHLCCYLISMAHHCVAHAWHRHDMEEQRDAPGQVTINRPWLEKRRALDSIFCYRMKCDFAVTMYEWRVVTLYIYAFN